MSPLSILFVLATGVLAGFVNTVGGGGSLLSMPMLILLGLPSAMANGTNRIALMVQSIVALTNFRSKGYFDIKLSLKFGIPALIGSIVGASFAVSLSDRLFNIILAVVMLIVLFVIVFEPHKKYIYGQTQINRKNNIIAMIVFFLIGIYGGFIQAGVGFVIIASLSVLTGFSLVAINSLKVFITIIYMFASLIIFIISGNVSIILGLILSVGMGIGAWLGASFAVAKGDKWIRIILIISVIAMSARLVLTFNF